ncbi:helicase-like transcription factor CHR28 isoform X5 [Sorghum bicolor]|uniref:helicase-like transcription factor CHR28 isoform X5 n=1 Tax=Sorghum bicolor TaxID=4558 RepID=UPI00081ACB7F|nr:helicase-like transcription factor CHR28 isoform X5 [Sorghum bicolor]|eukprot:XP_021313314.1 helicase-like transcription factor CHR28 isoform X5 [Sorghum bicolor]
MAEEPAVGYDGFEAAGDAGAGGAEDNLSMPLGDFMAFLETEPAPPEEGGEEEEEQEQLQPGVNQGCFEMPANTDGSEDLLQSHEDLWSNYSHVDTSECHMELSGGEQMIDHTEASPYEFFSNDLQNQSRTSNLDNEHFPRDASNHANVEEVAGPPYEDLSNGLYLRQQTLYSGQTQFQVENNTEGMETQMNTYFSGGISTEHSDLMLGSTGQDGDHFTSMGMFSLTHKTDVPDISCTEFNMGEGTESIRNGNSSCLTMQEAECGGYPHPDCISVDMVDERSLHDLPHGFSQNNEQYEMEQFPQSICESGSMQMGSPDQYCDDTSLSDFYMDVSSPESISCEQNQSEDICFKSESSTDSSPIPSSRNSTTEDADKYLGQTSKQLLDSKIVPFSNQHTFKNMGYQKPLALHKQYAYRSDNSSIHNSSRGCFNRDGDGASDLCVLEGNRNPAPDHRLPYQGKFHHNFQQHMYSNSMIPAFGGMRYKPHDERITLRLALQDISQPKSEANPPDGVLAVPLLRHQKIALSWMVQKETSSSHCSGGILADDQGLGKTVSAISLILTERSPVPQSSTIKNEPCEAVTLDDDDEDDSVEPHPKKLMQTCSSKVTTNTVKQENPFVAIKTRPAAGTLVVCPTSVLRQWAGELKNKVTSKANLSFLIYHGSNRTKDPNELTKYDVVLTTYSIVSMEVPKQSNPDSDDEEKGKPDRYGAPVSSSGSKKRKAPSKKTKCKSAAESCLPEKPLAKVAWFRVILDEAQSIKNYRTQVARACWGLRAKRRWCLSGTPIQNAVEDLYSYFRFLRYDPYAVYKQFCTMIKIPISRNPTNGYKKLQVVLKTVMLRRTKATMLDGKPIISLPPKTVSLKTVDFTGEERAFYNTLEVESREQFKEYAAAGTVKQNYVNILLMLLRLRQACDHPHLVRGYNSSSSWMSSLEMAKKLPMERQHELLNCLQSCSALCALCNDAPEDPVVTICGHVFCNQCILEQLTGDDSVCPVSNCRVRLNTTSLFSRGTLECSLSRLTCDFKSDDDTCMEMIHAEKRPGIDSSYASSKVRAALDILLSLPRIDPTQMTDSKCSIGLESEKFDGRGTSEQIDTKLTEKAIVFSQWTRMLDLLEVHLKASHVTYRRLDGTMSVAARDKAVKDFNTVPEVTVMIMSLKAASLGLNMVAACHVLMLDLWWNPTTEDQAVDRAHRIGQTRPVTVSRLTIKDTVEDRILALQEKKREMVASAFGEDKSGSRQTRLTVEDLNYLFMV